MLMSRGDDNSHPYQSLQLPPARSSTPIPCLALLCQFALRPFFRANRSQRIGGPRLLPRQVVPVLFLEFLPDSASETNVSVKLSLVQVRGLGRQHVGQDTDPTLLSYTNHLNGCILYHTHRTTTDPAPGRATIHVYFKIDTK